ncbi:MAG: response regulator [Rhodanobacter sp.]
MAFEAGHRVLLVEDDPVVAMVMEDILREMGLEVLVDHTLVNALCDIESAPFDVALIDVGLRGENARPVISALLKRGTPFAVMSGGDLSPLAVEFPQVPMHSKPLGMKALQEIVQKLLKAPTTRSADSTG